MVMEKGGKHFVLHIYENPKTLLTAGKEVL